jgi:nucleoside-diphosphate-sugar epimerase
MRIAAVTGASGFIGRHLCARLSDAGIEVRKLTHQGDGYVQEALDLAFTGADVVYHLAGLAHESRPSEEERYMQVNARLPVYLAGQAATKGVSGFVWLSTIKVLGDSTGQPHQVAAPYAPDGVYARSKVKAEQDIAALTVNMRIATVRPPLVYGPGVAGNFDQLLRLADSGWPVPVKAARSPRTMVGVTNLTDLLVSLGHSGQGTFHVGDAQDICVSELYSHLCTALDRPDRQIFVPKWLMKSGAALVGRSGMASRLFDPLQVDWSLTRNDLGWTPVCTLIEELERTVACYRQQN